MYISIKHVEQGLVDKICMIIYSIRAPATRASIPPETRLVIPALVVGTALWDAEELALALALAEVEAAALELSEVSVAEAEELATVLEAVVMVVAELVMSEELEVDFSEVVVLVAEVEDSVEDSVEVEAAVELALEDETETVEPSTVKRPM
jgi:hypothetical protein